MKKLLQDRKTLYLVLVIVVVSVFSLSIAYAAMSAVLEIHGNSEVVASSWDIHLENVKVKSGSVSANAPQISGTSSVGFDVELNTPGEFYEFTVDVVNEGSIDAMIDSVVKTPELTSEQVKYIKYEITYENGESISTKQTLKKGTSTPIKVRVEYRKDLVASDLPSTATELSLKLTLVYVQSDGTGNEITNNGANIVNVVSGDGTQVGNEVCIKDECFYVISSTDSTVTMLSKYNLRVGGDYSNDILTPYSESDIVTQNVACKGYNWDFEKEEEIYPYMCVTEYANEEKRGQYINDYDGSIIQEYIDNYNNYLNSLGVLIVNVRSIYARELYKLGCWFKFDAIAGAGSCLDAPTWIYSTSYWVDETHGDVFIYGVLGNGNLEMFFPLSEFRLGVRPVITISRDYL